MCQPAPIQTPGTTSWRVRPGVEGTAKRREEDGDEREQRREGAREQRETGGKLSMLRHTFIHSTLSPPGSSPPPAITLSH